MVIVWHWKSYDLLSRVLAIALLFNVIALPAAVTWGRIKRYDWQDLAPAYLWLMLATMLFGMR